MVFINSNKHIHFKKLVKETVEEGDNMYRRIIASGKPPKIITLFE